MTRGLCVLVACVLAVALATAQTPPKLDALPQCEVERVALQAQIVELRAQLVALQTQVDRDALAKERQRLTPTAAGFQWDWATLRFVPATSGAKDAK